MSDPDLIALTDRIVVRPWRPNEAARLFDMHRRPEVARWIGGRPMTDPGEAVTLIERNIDRLAVDPRFGAWAVIERSSGIPAGSVLLKPLPDSEGEIEIGWHLHPDSWGRGLATEAGGALLAYGLALGLDEVWAVTHLDNQRSVNVCRKLGLRLLGVTRRWYQKPSLMFWIGTHRDQQPSLSPDGPAPDRLSAVEQVVVQPEPPDTDRARKILRSYLDDVVSRYYGRAVTEAEMAAALEEFPSDDLALPKGVLLVAYVAGAVVGCVGLRLLADRTGEITRLFVAKSHHGRGLAKRLLDELEQVARNHGLTTLRLDTREDLVEARSLYARQGFHEVSPFNDGPYADHWYEKTLGLRWHCSFVAGTAVALRLPLQPLVGPKERRDLATTGLLVSGFFEAALICGAWDPGCGDKRGDHGNAMSARPVWPVTPTAISEQVQFAVGI